MRKCILFISVCLIQALTCVYAQTDNISDNINQKKFDPATLLWYDAPAKIWTEALPVGNGRLGAMVFGKYGEERIQLNEETYWSGGPYSTVVEGGAEFLPQIQKYIFNGEPIKAHKLFGRKLMGYPVEQQKYQTLADLMLFFENQNKVNDYKRWLDLSSGVTCVEYNVDGVKYRREILSSAPDQTIVVRLTADKSKSISFSAQLRGRRNGYESNYATDYFRMDEVGQDGLMVNGKSADYMGVEGKLRYKVQLKAVPEGGSMTVEDDYLTVKNADAVTIYIVAATNFVDYKDVSADQNLRVKNYLKQIDGKTYKKIYADAVADYQKLFNRVSLELPKTETSYLPTNKRMTSVSDKSDPSLASLSYNFGRYILISSSRLGTEAANLQGIWNDDMNPAWDSKYTTNINLQMNYWPAESGNLSECSEPLITLVKELTDQGSQVAKKHYGASGWVMHQNTDLWRVAAPMDGPCWGTFTVGGAWLTNQIYDHYLYNPDVNYLKEIYPVMKGSVEFFMDFLIEDPQGKWLVTNPSTSPENPPKAPGYKYFFDEVTAGFYFTTICYGATMDIQILTELFGYYIETAKTLNVDHEFSKKVAMAKSRLAPPKLGKDGTLKEWAQDFDQLEDKHRHFSHMYGLYPGNVISMKKTPHVIDGCKAVLNQRGDGASGFSRGWKMALWARMYDGNRANVVFKKYMLEECFPQLISKNGKAFQIDGTMGVAAGIAEMLVQSHDGNIHLLPALPDEWNTGNFAGVCVRGGFELNLKWKDKLVTEVDILSKVGELCRIDAGGKFIVTKDGKKLASKLNKDGSFEFKTVKGGKYKLSKR